MGEKTRNEGRVGRVLVLTAFIVSAFILPAASALAQLTSLRVGTNSPSSAESVLFGIARDAGILKQNQLDVEVIFIAGGTLSMQALIGELGLRLHRRHTLHHCEFRRRPDQNDRQR
jgi:ABC-type nitrate/sulfonate/bicarbonate transport system substrate-binding protein